MRETRVPPAAVSLPQNWHPAQGRTDIAVPHRSLGALTAAAVAGLRGVSSGVCRLEAKLEEVLQKRSLYEVRKVAD